MVISVVMVGAYGLAHIGLNEHVTREQGSGYESARDDFGDSDWATTEDQVHGFAKIGTPPGENFVLGMDLVDRHGGQLAAFVSIRFGPRSTNPLLELGK